jgi:hypothetical protein
MDATVAAAVIGGVSGLLAGVVGSLVAPWIHWGIEKRRDRRTTQRDLLSAAREYAASREFGASSFAKHAVYARLKPHFNTDVVRAVENPEDVQDQMDDPGEFRESLRREVLDELTRIEQEWGLI